MSGELFDGRYRLIELLGEGGMGRVWRARDEALDRQTAVKEVIFPHGMDALQRRQLGERAMREARAAARLTHPGITTVYDVFLHQGAPIIVMELIDGPSLAHVIARHGRLPPGRVIRIGALLLEALGQAHAAGIIHRDLKPANVLLTGERVVITDFGIASLAGEATLTAAGAVIGTPAFMAPEQARSLSPGPAWDLWSLGATLYNAVEGHPPYRGHTYAILGALLNPAPPPAPMHAGPLTGLLAGLLRKDPAQRMTHSQAARALDDALADRPAPSWDTPFGRPLTSHTGGHTASVEAVALGEMDGRPIAVTGGADHTVRVWDLAAGQQLGEHLVSDTSVTSVAVGRLGRRTIAVTGGRDVVVWDLAAGKSLYEPLRTTNRVSSIALAPLAELGDRTVALTGLADGTLVVWDLAAGRRLWGPWTGPTDAVAIGELNGRTIAVSTGGERTVGMWDLGTGRPLGSRLWRARMRSRLKYRRALNAVAVGRLDGRTIAVTGGGYDGAIRVWDLASGRGWHLGAPEFSASRVEAVAMGRLGGQTVAVTGGGYDGKVQVWDLTAGRRLAKTLIGHTATVKAVAMGQLNGKAIAVTAGDDRTVRMWELGEG